MKGMQECTWTAMLGMGMTVIHLGLNCSDSTCSPRRCYQPLQVNIQGLEENLLPGAVLAPREHKALGNRTGLSG